MIKPQHILVSRTDNIGDVVLTLPMATLLKKYFPQCKISFLARDYVKAVVEACPDVDQFISSDTLLNNSPSDAVEYLKSLQADMIIHVFPHKKIAQLAKQANISLRIGTSHRLFHWWTCNKRVRFSRKKSDLHEAQLNLALFAPLKLPTILSLSDLSQEIRLEKNKTLSKKMENFLEADKFNLIIHPLTNGNTKEWSLQNFEFLIKKLDHNQFNIIITGSPHEAVKLAPLLDDCPQVKNAVGQCSLQEFVELISHADGLVANSTGPLHIAAAFGIYALGLFPCEPGKAPARWKPLGKRAEYLTANNTKENSMDSISVDNVLEKINAWKK